MKALTFFLFILISSPLIAKGYDVFGLGYYDVKFDGSNNNAALDFRYERRFDYSLYEIGPSSYEFFNIKPFAGIEGTSDSAYFFIAGVYLSLIYINRGFGIVALTHAFYDLFVIFQLT